MWNVFPCHDNTIIGGSPSPCSVIYLIFLSWYTLPRSQWVNIVFEEPHSSCQSQLNFHEQIPIILGVWPFWLTPFFFRSVTFWRAYGRVQVSTFHFKMSGLLTWTMDFGKVLFHDPSWYLLFNTMRTEQNGHFADCINFIKNVNILFQISKFVLNFPINKSSLVQVMAWCQIGTKPLSGPMMGGGGASLWHGKKYQN